MNDTFLMAIVFILVTIIIGCIFPLALFIEYKVWMHRRKDRLREEYIKYLEGEREKNRLELSRIIKESIVYKAKEG